jgi:predicted N-acetyltransferase YhbS
MERIEIVHSGAALTLPISPLVGEMGGSPEGGAVPPPSLLAHNIANREAYCPSLPPSALPGISPTRGEIGSFTISAEKAADIAARDALLDRAMGPNWRRKASEKLRRGRVPAEGLAFVARDFRGDVVGTVRLWDVRLEGLNGTALLLGPLAVEPSLKNAGIGSALMHHAIREAEKLGHGAILLVGDAPYYTRFGFSSERTRNLAMPGPYEPQRFLALELVAGALDGARGVLRPVGRRMRRDVLVAAA